MKLKTCSTCNVLKKLKTLVIREVAKFVFVIFFLKDIFFFLIYTIVTIVESPFWIKLI